MENEIRFYLKNIRNVIDENDAKTSAETDIALITEDDEGQPKFKPSYIVTAVKLPTGAIELATNTSKFVEKIDYILEAYDEDMKLKVNPEVQMLNVMIV